MINKNNISLRLFGLEVAGRMAVYRCNIKYCKMGNIIRLKSVHHFS